ncbi:hypothetical protein yinte0001_16270 [Yersinia intermedia ATCC 29909]|nr:hypothetical protein yinte0001_16270 [Yersinia intermedia ATCC 29909]
MEIIKILLTWLRHKDPMKYFGLMQSISAKILIMYLFRTLPKVQYLAAHGQ